MSETFSILSILPNDVVRSILSDWIKELWNVNIAISNYELRRKFIECAKFPTAFWINSVHQFERFCRWQRHNKVDIEMLSIRADMFDLVAKNIPTLKKLSLLCQNTSCEIDITLVLRLFPRLDKFEVVNTGGWCVINMSDLTAEHLFPLQTLSFNSIIMKWTNCGGNQSAGENGKELLNHLQWICAYCPDIHRLDIHNCPQFSSSILVQFAYHLHQLSSLEYTPYDKRRHIIHPVFQPKITEFTHHNMIATSLNSDDQIVAALTASSKNIPFLTLKDMHFIAASKEIMHQIFVVICPGLLHLCLYGCVFPNPNQHDDQDMLLQCYHMIATQWKALTRLEFHSCENITNELLTIVCDTCKQLTWLELDGSIVASSSSTCRQKITFQLLGQSFVNLTTLILSNCFFLKDEDIQYLCQTTTTGNGQQPSSSLLHGLEKLEIKFCKCLTVQSYQYILEHLPCHKIRFRIEYTKDNMLTIPQYFLTTLLPLSSLYSHFHSYDWMNTFFTNMMESSSSSPLPNDENNIYDETFDRSSSSSTSADDDDDEDDDYFQSVISIKLLHWNPQHLSSLSKNNNNNNNASFVDMKKKKPQTLYWNKIPISPYSLHFIQSTTVLCDEDNLLSLH